MAKAITTPRSTLMATSTTLCTRTPMAPSFPLELVLLVASHVNQDTLKNFSLTASVFRDFCQSAIFSHILLSTSSSTNAQGETPGERLLALLSSSPRLIPYVKRITISDFDNPWASWLTNDMKLAEALDKLDLTKIEGFELERNYRAQWIQLNHSVRRIIVEICRSPALVDLSLSWAPLALVGVCGPALKRLKAHDCSVGSYAADIAPQPSVISLETLQIYHYFDLDGVIRFFLDSTQIRVDALRSAHITVSFMRDYIHVPSLLEKCRNSLETLTLVPCTEISCTPSTFMPRKVLICSK